MLINDEYEKLAKLLYPSIEASGNVYYGQTRKLSLDELFDKNNGGFESWIDLSKTYNDNEQINVEAIPCMFWKLGPFYGSIKIDNGIENSTDVFAKYKIELNTIKKDNIVQSGDFNTYEVNATCSWVDYIGTNCVNPVNDEDALNNDITFCIDNKNKYLYIRLVRLDENGEVAEWKNNDYFAANIKQPLTLTCVTDGYVGLHLPFSNSINESHFNSYEYSLNNGKWTRWEIGKTGFHPDVYEEGSETTYNDVVEWADLNPIKMNKDDTLKVRCFGNFVLDNLQVYHATSCTHFLLSGTYNLSGNGFSMTRGTAYANVVSAQPLELMHLFSDYGNIGSIYEEIIHYVDDDSCSHGYVDNIIWNGGIVDASAFVLPATQLAKSCYECMFFNNKQLKYPPRLPATQLAESCYRSMFSYCDKLEKVPILPAEHFDKNCRNCYEYMFYKCSSLETAHYFISNPETYFDDTGDYLYNYCRGMYSQCDNIKSVYMRDQFADCSNIFSYGDDAYQNRHLYFNALIPSDTGIYGNNQLRIATSDNRERIFNKDEMNKRVVEASIWENDVHKNTAKLCLRQPLKEVTTFGYDNDDYKPEYDDNGDFKNPTIINGEFKKGGLQQKIYGRKEFVNPTVFDNGIYTHNGFIRDENKIDDENEVVSFAINDTYNDNQIFLTKKNIAKNKYTVRIDQYNAPDNTDVKEELINYLQEFLDVDTDSILYELTPTGCSGLNNLYIKFDCFYDGTYDEFSNKCEEISEKQEYKSIFEDAGIEWISELDPQYESSIGYRQQRAIIFDTNYILPDNSDVNIGNKDNKFNSLYVNTICANKYCDENGDPINSEATKLINARSISGIKFDGSSDIIYYGVCSSSEGAEIKDVTIPNFELVEGATVIVKFINKHRSSGAMKLASLRVNTSGTNGTPKPIMFNGDVLEGSSVYDTWQDGDIVKFVYDGDFWVCLGYSKYSSYAFGLAAGDGSTKLSAARTDIIAYTSIVPSESAMSSPGYNLGSEAYKWKDIYTTNIYTTSITADALGVTTLIASTIDGANLTISKSSISNIPESEVEDDYYDGDVVTIPIGGLILVCPDRTWMQNNGKGRNIRPGESIKITAANKTAFNIAEWRTSDSSGAYYSGKSLEKMNTYAFLKVGTYRTLSYITYPANSTAVTYGAPILLQRIL